MFYIYLSLFVVPAELRFVGVEMHRFMIVHVTPSVLVKALSVCLEFCSNSSG